MNKKNFAQTAAAALLLVGLSACAVPLEPLSPQDNIARAAADLDILYAGQERITGPLTIEEAVARALKYNYDKRLAAMELALQDSQLEVATLNMLPRIAASAGYNVRDPERASSSKQSPQHSVSEDKERWSGDVSFSWNLLDFGVSYYNAKQQANRALVAVERRRRVVNNMLKEVHAAFWRAATAERLLPKLDPVLQEAHKALAASEEIESNLLQRPLDMLDYRKSLLQVISQLKRLQSDLRISKAQLSALINLPPGEPFDIAPLPQEIALPRKLSLDAADLELYALAARPELREEVYQERIDRNGVHKEIVRMLPGVSLLGSLQFDTNSYLKANTWAEAGLRATWNLLNLVHAPAVLDAAERQVDVAKLRRLALSVAVITQINISHQQYLLALENFDTAERVNRIEARIDELTRGSAAAQAVPELERIRRAMQSVVAQLEADRSLVEVQLALANIYVSIGLDLLPPFAEDVGLAALTAQVREALHRLSQGIVPPLPAPPPADA